MSRPRPAPERTPCPGCRAPLLESDIYCRACGEDARWIPRAGRVVHRIPRALEIEQFQDPGDRAASKALALASPVQAAVRFYLRRVAEPEYRNQLLGSALKASASQFPRVHRLTRFCERILGTPPVEIYLATSAEAAAVSVGKGATNVLVLSTLTVPALTDDELLFFLGSMLGHVKADHVVYLTVAKALTTALKGIPGLGSPLSGMASYALVPWQRQAVLTADRAGLICCQDLAAAASALAKLTFGATPLNTQMKLGEVLAQGDQLTRDGDFGDTWKPAPAFVRRLVALRDFRESPDWARIFEGAWDPAAPRFPCYFCPGGGSPAAPEAPLGELRCDDCDRELLVEEVPCPACHAAIPVEDETPLLGLACPACERGYLAGTRRPHLRLQDPDAIRERSHYRTLGVHPSARPATIRRAFRERMEPLRQAIPRPGEPHPAREKIRIYAAYKTLLDPVLRAGHDRLLDHARELLEDDATPFDRGCTTCRAPLRGAFCGQCGAPTEEAVEPSRPGTFAHRLVEALTALQASGAGDLVTAPRDVFHLAFHRPGRSLFVALLPALVRPGPLRSLLRAAGEVRGAAGWAHAPEFVVAVEGDVDLDLARAILARERDPAVRELSFVVLRPTRDPGEAKVTEVSLAAGDAEEPPEEALGDWLARRLGVSLQETA